MSTTPRRTARPKRPSAPAEAGREAAGSRRDLAHEVVGVYKRITGIIWQRLSPTFGIRTINAIARNVIARRSRDRELALLEVGPEGLIWDKLDAQARPPDPGRLQEQLDHFLSDFFEALANLIGRLMAGKIFRDAEELARQGEAE